MGNKPTTNLAEVALSCIAEMKDNSLKYSATKETNLKNTYVDTTFRLAPDIDQIY